LNAVRRFVGWIRHVISLPLPQPILISQPRKQAEHPRRNGRTNNGKKSEAPLRRARQFFLGAMVLRSRVATLTTSGKSHHPPLVVLAKMARRRRFDEFCFRRIRAWSVTKKRCGGLATRQKHFFFLAHACDHDKRPPADSPLDHLTASNSQQIGQSVLGFLSGEHWFPFRAGRVAAGAGQRNDRGINHLTIFSAGRLDPIRNLHTCNFVSVDIFDPRALRKENLPASRGLLVD